MKLRTPGGAPHLTYCTNIHAGETWPEVHANLERYVVAVKSRVASDRDFGVGLRLSAQAAAELAHPGELRAFRDWLRRHGLYVFTINGFPYGTFHTARVKESVYLPDWLDEERLAYTERLAGLLAELMPDDATLAGSVSTVPGAFRPRVRSPADVAQMAERLLRLAASLHGLEERTGKLVRLALEPEPFCYFETTDETIRFFEDELFSRAAVARFARLRGLAAAQAEARLRRHLGVCLDACHLAVQFEDPEVSVARLHAAGITIPKIQLSAGLEAEVRRDDAAITRALQRFADDVYLHQVIERGDPPVRDLDLPDALARLGAAPSDAPRVWRIHFHVPIFRETLGPFRNTQAALRQLLMLQRRQGVSDHLEVETYTWDVLPDEYRREDIVDAIARELDWVRAELGAEISA